MRILMLVIAALVLVLIGCRKSEPAHGPFREFAFTVDSTRLGTQTGVAGITFRVPRGWMAADSSILARVRQIASDDTSEFSVDPQNVFIGSDIGGILIATTYRVKPAAAEGFTGWTHRYLKAYRAAHPEINLQEEWLLLSNAHAVQLMAMDTLRVQFKFLIESDPVVSLDFSVPRTAWEKEVRAVESSLGTIRKR
jgi:hypothetical protein